MTEVPVIIRWPDPISLYQAIGRAISQFSLVELGLNVCFADIMAPADRELSAVAISSIRSFDEKVRMVNSVARKRLVGEALEKWEGIYGKLGERQKFRNKLAHWAVTPYPGAASLEDLKNQKFGLLPGPHSPEHFKAIWQPKSTKVKPITEKQINDFTSDCINLFAKIVEFSEYMKTLNFP